MKWIQASDVIECHDWLLALQPGVKGMRDKGKAEAVIHRIHNIVHYEGIGDLYELAAQYLVAVSRGHIFNDGNKRTAFLIAILFLWRNGLDVEDDGKELVECTISAASGELTRQEIANVFKKLSRQRSLDY